MGKQNKRRFGAKRPSKFSRYTRRTNTNRPTYDLRNHLNNRTAGQRPLNSSRGGQDRERSEGHSSIRRVTLSAPDHPERDEQPTAYRKLDYPYDRSELSRDYTLRARDHHAIPRDDDHHNSSPSRSHRSPSVSRRESDRSNRRSPTSRDTSQTVRSVVNSTKRDSSTRSPRPSSQRLSAPDHLARDEQPTTYRVLDYQYDQSDQSRDYNWRARDHHSMLRDDDHHNSSPPKSHRSPSVARRKSDRSNRRSPTSRDTSQTVRSVMNTRRGSSQHLTTRHNESPENDLRMQRREFERKDSFNLPRDGPRTLKRTQRSNETVCRRNDDEDGEMIPFKRERRDFLHQPSSESNVNQMDFFSTTRGPRPSSQRSGRYDNDNRSVFKTDHSPRSPERKRTPAHLGHSEREKEQKGSAPWKWSPTPDRNHDRRTQKRINKSPSKYPPRESLNPFSSSSNRTAAHCKRERGENIFSKMSTNDQFYHDHESPPLKHKRPLAPLRQTRRHDDSELYMTTVGKPNTNDVHRTRLKITHFVPSQEDLANASSSRSHDRDNCHSPPSKRLKSSSSDNSHREHSRSSRNHHYHNHHQENSTSQRNSQVVASSQDRNLVSSSAASPNCKNMRGTKDEAKIFEPLGYKALEGICNSEEADKAMTEIIFKKGRYTALLNSSETIREDLFKLVIESLLLMLKSTNRPTEKCEIIRITSKQLLRSHFPEFLQSSFDSEVVLKVILILKMMMQLNEQDTTDDLGGLLYQIIIIKQNHTWQDEDELKKEFEHLQKLYEKAKQPKSNKESIDDDEIPPDDFRELSIAPTNEEFKSGERPYIRKNVIDKAYSSIDHYLDVQFRLLREDCFLGMRNNIRHMRLRDEAEQNHKISFLFKAVKILHPVCSRLGGVYTIQIDLQRCGLQQTKWERWKKLTYGSLVCLSDDSFKNVIFATVENRDVSNLRYGLVDLKFLDYDNEVMNEHIHKGTVFQMMENEAFFEAYQHNLTVLQQMDDEKFPFKEHIVYCNNEIDPPKYLKSFQYFEDNDYGEREHDNGDEFDSDAIAGDKRKGNEFEDHDDGSDDNSYNDDNESWKSDENVQANRSPRPNSSSSSSEIAESQRNRRDNENESQADADHIQLNFSSIVNNDDVQLDENISKIPALDFNRWPTKEILGLDDSQFRAFRLALTKRFALIQGPPGTGKTYVGLKIAQVLLDSMESITNGKRSPILMVSYTNHALDQFLMGLKLKEGIVRVGGRSREDKLKQYNLKELKQALRSSDFKDPDITRESSRLWKEKNDISRDHLLRESSTILKESYKGVLSLNNLARWMSKEHYSYLKTRITSDDKKPDGNENLMEWLKVEYKDNIAEERKSQEVSDRIYGSDDFRRVFDPRVFDQEEDEELLAHYTEQEEGELIGLPECQVICYQHQAKNPGNLYAQLKSDFQTSQNEESRVCMLFDLPLKERWRLYRLWRARLQAKCQQNINDCQREGYEGVLQRLYEVGRDEDLAVLRKAKVIGMTTTCAAKNRDLLQRIKPKIVLIEEAAEVLEAHILTSIPLECEHVILIGDHQQLRPNCNVFELSKKYNLSISMFERLVKQGIPCERLSVSYISSSTDCRRKYWFCDSGCRVYN